jgi:alanine racemase
MSKLATMEEEREEDELTGKNFKSPDKLDKEPNKETRKDILIVRKKEKGKIVEVNTTNLQKNLEFLKSRIRKGSKIFPVVKSAAYGHGITNVVSAIENLADGWCVALVEEAEKVRKISQKNILVMKGTFSDEEDQFCQKNNIWIVVRDFYDLTTKIKKGIKNLFIKLDTGMGRLGILKEELPKALELIKSEKAENLIIGAISHFAYSDLEDERFISEQIKSFSEMTSFIEKSLGKKLIKTLSNSAATIELADAHFDFTRPGIALYGISPFGKNKKFELEPVLSVKTKVISTKKIPKGWSVGYSRKFIAEKESKIAILNIGYSDGLPRAWWENGVVYAKGKKLKIVGVISMDMTAVLCENVELYPGDEVIILGIEDGITVYDIAEKTGKITYEILCSIGLKNS